MGIYRYHFRLPGQTVPAKASAGLSFPDDPIPRHARWGSEIGELYRLLHQAAVEAEAAWSLLADSGDGTRVFSIRAALVPIALLLIDKEDDIIVLDVRIPTQR